jgi:hypothetical protein
MLGMPVTMLCKWKLSTIFKVRADFEKYYFFIFFIYFHLLNAFIDIYILSL